MRPPKSNKRRVIGFTIAIFVLASLSLLLLGNKPVSADPTTNKVGTIAETTTTQPPVVGLPTMSATSSIVKMFSALVIVVICIYGAVFALKKMMGRRVTGSGRAGILEVLETAHLGPKKTVSVVRIANKSVLIGVTENQISLLSELDEEMTAEITTVAEEDITAKNFGDIFKVATNKIKELSSRKPEAVLDN